MKNLLRYEITASPMALPAGSKILSVHLGAATNQLIMFVLAETGAQLVQREVIAVPAAHPIPVDDTWAYVGSVRTEGGNFFHVFDGGEVGYSERSLLPKQGEDTVVVQKILIETLVGFVRRATGEIVNRQTQALIEQDLRTLLREHGVKVDG